MQPDDLSPPPDDSEKVTRRRPARPRLLAWLGPASLGLLFVATSWAVGVYASPWLVVPYWIAMAFLVGLPSGNKSAGSARSNLKDHEDRPSITEVPPRPLLADLGPSTVVEDSDNPDWEKENEPTSDPSTVKTKKAKSRSRKAKTSTVIPARVEPEAAVWVHVEPGKFIRADMLHPRAPEVQEPTPPAISPEVVESIESEVSELPSPDLHSAPNPPDLVSDKLEAIDEIEVLDVVLVPTIEDTTDSFDVIDAPSIADSVEDVLMITESSEIAGDQGIAPETLAVELTGSSTISTDFEPMIDDAVMTIDSEVILDHEAANDAILDVQPQESLATLAREETEENSEVEEPWNLESKESGFEGEDDEIPAVRRPARPNIYGTAGPRSKGRRRGLVEAGLSSGGDRSNRNSPGTSRASRRSGRWAAQGRPSRAGRSHPPRSPPCRRRAFAWWVRTRSGR